MYAITDIDQQVAVGELTLPSIGVKNTRVKIHRSNTKIVLEFYSPESLTNIKSGEFGSFRGVIEDTPTSVKMKDVYVTNVSNGTSGKRVLAEATEGVIVGAHSEECSSISLSVNTLLPNIDNLQLGEYRLIVVGEEVDQIVKNLFQDSRGTTQFQSEVMLSGPVKSRTIYAEEICSVIKLLGIMLSSSLYTWKTRYKGDSDDITDHYSFNGAQGIGISKSVVNASCFMESAYPTWSSLSERMKKSLYVCSSYIAVSCNGYLDTEMFSLFQAWELLARSYKKECNGNYNSIDDKINKFDQDKLAAALKETYERWCIDCPDSHHQILHNFNRLISSTRKIIVKDAIDSLIDNFKLDAEAIGFDKNRFRKLSDGIRHTGMLKPKDEYWDDFDLYTNAKFSLELIIFKILKYDGLIKYEEDKVFRIKPICEFFTV
ncbi:MAG: hypothetical protein AB8B97_11030 [Granulosicoccus sp.]